MATLREKAEKMLDEGMDAARMLVRQHVGLAGVHGDPGSIYSFDLTREARAIEVDLDAVSDGIRGFLAMSAVGPTEEERAAQRQLDLDDAIAAGRRLVAAGATSVSVGDTTTDITPPRSPAIRGDDPRITQAIDEIQGRLGAEQIDIYTTDAHPGDLVIRWGGRRGSLPIDLALGTLEACADGCGPEAVWHALLQAERLAEGATVEPPAQEPQPAVEEPPQEPRSPATLREVEMELSRVGVGSMVRAGAPGRVVISHGPETISMPIEAAVRALDRFTPGDETIAWQELLATSKMEDDGATWDEESASWRLPEPGRAAGEAPAPRKRRGSREEKEADA